MAITITKGHSKSLVDGIEVKYMNDDTFYFLDGSLLLQTHMNLIGECKHEVVFVAQALTISETKKFNDLINRLSIDNKYLKQEILLFQNGHWNL